MKKYLLRLIAMMCAVVMMVALATPMVSAFPYRKGSNEATASYKAGHYYKNLNNIDFTLSSC